jgi:hypothetical protein
VSEAEKNSSKLTLLFLFSFLLWAGALVVIIFCFFWFTQGNDCTLEIVLISVTLGLGVIYTVLSVGGCFEHGCKK